MLEYFKKSNPRPLIGTSKEQISRYNSLKWQVFIAAIVCIMFVA